MNRTLQIELLERCLQHIQHKTTQMSAQEVQVDLTRYQDEKLFAQELLQLFRRVPQIVAHSSELPEPGSFVTRTFAGVPLLLARDEKGTSRAFLNICRHRGARVVTEVQGKASHFSCPYHAWSYGTNGRLMGVPHGKQGFPTLAREQNGLFALPCEEALGFLWVIATPDASDSLSLREELGPIYEDLESFGFQELSVFASDTQEWGTNWKLIVEGGIESYHFREAHKATIAPMFFDNLSIYDRFGSHFRSVLPKRSLETLQEKPHAEWDLRPHANVLYSLFPSTSLLVQPNHVTWIQAIPTSATHTTVTYRMLVPTSDEFQQPKAEQHWQRNRELTLRTLEEDFALAEQIQQGFGCAPTQTLQFGRYEGALVEFHEILSQRLSRP